MKRSTPFILGVLLAVLLLAACGQSAGTGGAAATASTGQIPQATAMVEQPTTAATEPTAGTAAEPTAGTAAEPTAATAEQPTAQSAAGGGLLDVVKQRGKLMIATDANYKPQSFKNADGTWEGFDIGVGREIAKRLGVQAEFLDISFDVITAGSWNGRWDMNVGSM